MHVDSRGTAMMDLLVRPSTPHGIFQLTGLTGPFVKGCGCPILHEEMGYDIPEYGIESLPMGRN